MFAMTIPPFMLKQMYRASSLRNRPDGFEFALHNPLMSATIVGVRDLTLNSGAIALNLAHFDQAGATRTAESVSETAPVAFDKGSEILVFVPGAPLPIGEHALKVQVKTEEFGTITISLSDQVRG